MKIINLNLEFLVHALNQSFQLGPGLFLGISAIDHSCAPNAVYISHGKNLIVRSIEDKIENFLDVRVCYYQDLKHTSDVRRQSLLSSHYFLCECPNCCNEEKNQLKSSMVCKKCNGCVPSTSGICVDCKTQVTSIIFAFSQKEKKVWKIFKNT